MIANILPKNVTTVMATFTTEQPTEIKPCHLFQQSSYTKLDIGNNKMDKTDHYHDECVGSKVV